MAARMIGRTKITRVMDVISAASGDLVTFEGMTVNMVVSACGNSDNRVTFTCSPDQAKALLCGKVRVTIEEVRDDG